MGESPVYTAFGHVFTIDPKTKKTWIQSSSSAVEINYFFDPTKSCYRIVSIEDAPNGKKVIINSTLTDRMNFKKTSQKFGQWSDMKQSTIFGLGFNSESDLDGFVEQFKTSVEFMRKKQQQQNVADSSTPSAVPVTANNSNSQHPPPSMGRNWTNNAVASPSQSHQGRVLLLETELERMTKRIEEMKIEHKTELIQLQEELDRTNTGALGSTVESVKATKDLRSRVTELESENRDLRTRLQDQQTEPRQLASQLSGIVSAHSQMEALLSQLTSYHYVMGQKLTDLVPGNTNNSSSGGGSTNSIGSSSGGSSNNTIVNNNSSDMKYGL